VERGLAESLEKAQALVMAGAVFSETKRLDKAGAKIPADAPLLVKGKEFPWVSRGGVKLAHGLDEFKIDPAGLVCLDIGQSTGGFTDVLLSRGALRVYGVDVGHGQLAWKLRQDDRVVVLERTNARYLEQTNIPEDIHLIVCDVSFIGLEKALPAALSLAAPQAFLVALVKPQFEAKREQVEKGGIVRDEKVRAEVLERIENWLENVIGWQVLGKTQSPITGADGNREFLIAAIKKDANNAL
jgi:23S rRNA (cytidine1920-2'-O)/16S rRNA (cytidine1409-2'-O)-methyltransferase